MNVRKKLNRPGMTGSVLPVAMAMFAPMIAHSATVWEPCGGAADTLWAWAWAGENSSNVTLSTNNFGTEIRFMGDLSGNGNDYFNDDPFNQDPPTRPAYRNAPTIGSWSTSHAIVGSDNYDSGSRAYVQYMHQASDMVASSDFYLAFAGYDSRADGHRVIWGTTGSNRVRYEQLENSVDISIGGTDLTLTGKDAWSDGPILIEVWRDAAGSLHAWVNGTDRTSGNISNSSTLRLNGIGGGDPAGNSAFDDHAFEYVACDGIPSSTQRADVREYLRAKWQLYGDAAPPPVKPNPPSEFTVE